MGAASAGDQLFDLEPGSPGARAGISLVAPAQVMPVYFPVADRLVPAYSGGGRCPGSTEALTAASEWAAPHLGYSRLRTSTTTILWPELELVIGSPPR